jgi:hypothetical protein
VPVHGRPELEHRSNDRGRVIGDEGVEGRDGKGRSFSPEGKVQGVSGAVGWFRELDEVAILAARGVLLVWRRTVN